MRNRVLIIWLSIGHIMMCSAQEILISLIESPYQVAYQYKEFDTLRFDNGVHRIGYIDYTSQISEAQGAFYNNLKQGVWHYYTHKDSVSILKTFDKGLLDGAYKVFHKGIPIYETNFTKGSGYWRAYDKNGIIKEEGKLIEGKKYGVWCTYTNGLIEEIKEHVEGQDPLFLFKRKVTLIGKLVNEQENPIVNTLVHFKLSEKDSRAVLTDFDGIFFIEIDRYDIQANSYVEYIAQGYVLKKQHINIQNFPNQITLDTNGKVISKEEYDKIKVGLITLCGFHP
ncbi:toxin-antitoxin system YwqK family antitoxin [Aquimarina algicola]|uniref:Uncharacterized protein n=1 Tax=Aquimarina algicola TaxID=2589995 RepID=A0A504JCH0_9FLAO|nr:hypothetical protein [Aquimarina algicola]TPN86292.1 hypothetical protein FHK87_13580 [Aquimarina algicola]